MNHRLEITSQMYNNRTFFLQRIVEVAEVNIDRIKIIWSRMWNIIKVHFARVGCHQNSIISMYAIDSLK